MARCVNCNIKYAIILMMIIMHLPLPTYVYWLFKQEVLYLHTCRSFIDAKPSSGQQLKKGGET